MRALLLLLSACAIAGGDVGTGEQESGGTTYVDAVDFSGTDQGAWYDATDAVRTQIVAAFPDVTPLSFHCAVSSKIGSVHDCAWTLASAATAVDGGTAAIAVDAHTYECHIHPRTTVGKLLPLLAASDSLHTALPGTTSIADAISACVTAEPVPSGGAGTTYVPADAYYTTAAYQQKWTDTAAAFVRGFDNVCGDTFCGGDFGDLRSLALTCSITQSSGNVKSCAWVFGGSYATVATNGALTETAQTWRCNVAMHGTLPQLIAVLTAAGSDNPIQRALPGGTATAYDALAGCLP
jgi:hypothetical protein